MDLDFELDDEKLVRSLNRQRAAGFTDYKWRNVAAFLDNPKWHDEVLDHEAALIAGRPKGSIFSTMGKREKKASLAGSKGSRMTAYLNIPMRVIETKYLSTLDEAGE